MNENSPFTLYPEACFLPDCCIVRHVFVLNVHAAFVFVPFLSRSWPLPFHVRACLYVVWFIHDKRVINRFIVGIVVCQAPSLYQPHWWAHAWLVIVITHRHSLFVWCWSDLTGKLCPSFSFYVETNPDVHHFLFSNCWQSQILSVLGYEGVLMAIKENQPVLFLFRNPSFVVYPLAHKCWLWFSSSLIVFVWHNHTMTSPCLLFEIYFRAFPPVKRNNVFLFLVKLGDNAGGNVDGCTLMWRQWHGLAALLTPYVTHVASQQVFPK